MIRLFSTDPAAHYIETNCPLTVNGSVTATSFNENSDYRLKTSINPMAPDASVNGLNPVTYRLKTTDSQQIGLIAHEVQEHFPELVTGDKDGDDMQAINYSGLIPVLINDIQRLIARIDAQDKIIADMHRNNADCSA